MNIYLSRMKMYVDLVLDFLGFVLDFGCLGIMRVDR